MGEQRDYKIKQETKHETNTQGKTQKTENMRCETTRKQKNCILGLKFFPCRSLRFLEIWIPRYLVLFFTGISHIRVSSVLYRHIISHFKS